MKILLENIGKRYNYEWIFRKLTTQFDAGKAYAILGPNGSGKSTLLQIMAGSLSHSEGRIRYFLGEKEIAGELIFQHLSIAAPYLELVEEMTLKELFGFQQEFKPFIPQMSTREMMEAVRLEKAAHKQVRYFSSGMKQRARLALALFADTPLLLLDEPCANLDEEGAAIYQQLITRYQRDRLVIICSNDAREYACCKESLQITDYK